MNRKVSVEDLKLGMFVADLDRPWLDTPFLLQGFVIESAEEIEQLRRICRFVYVDTNKSVGEAYEAPARVDVARHGVASEPAGVLRRAAALTARPRRTAREARVDVGTPGAKSRQPGGWHDTAEDAAVSGVQGRATPPALASSRAEPIRKDFPMLSVRVMLGSVQAIEHSQAPRRDWLKRVGSLFRPAAPGAAAPPAEPPPTRTFGDIELVTYEDTASVEQEMKRAELSHERSRELLEQIARDIRKDLLLDVAMVHEAVGGMVESIIRNPDAMVWLTRLKQRDNYAYGHAIDVSIYMIAFGRHLGFPRAQLTHLGVGGLLMDVGKIKVPENILKKAGVLTPEELELARSHVGFGVDIVADNPETPREVVDAVATHHERLDGSGYPEGLKNSEIGMLGGMAGIVDTFQALTSERPYAHAVSAHEAMQELYSWRGRLFHAALVEQFIQCLGIFPAGSLIELVSGEVAVVVTQNRVRKLKPRVMILLDREKKPLDQPVIMDLMKDPLAPDGTPYQIRRALAPGSHGIDPRQYYL